MQCSKKPAYCILSKVSDTQNFRILCLCGTSGDGLAPYLEFAWPPLDINGRNYWLLMLRFLNNLPLLVILMVGN
jgi:hypothetical protein